MNFFRGGQIIKKRLLEAVPGVEHIGYLGRTNEIGRQFSSAVYLIPLTTNPSTGTDRRAEAMEVQTWGVMLAMRHEAAQKDIEPMLVKADALLAQISQSLQGFKHERLALPIRRVRSERFVHAPAFTIFPLSFELSFIAD